MKESEKADLLKQLALLLKAGIPLAKSIEILSEGKQAPRARQILKKLHEGLPLSETLDWGGEIKTLINIGEQNGSLEESLERSACRIEGRIQFKQSIKKALSYPALVLFLSLTCFLMVLIFVLPTFANIFSDFDQKLPALTIFVLNLSKYWYSLPLLFLILAGAVLGFFRSEARFRLPIIKYIFLSDFCRSLGEQLKNGVPILKAIHILELAQAHAFIKKEIAGIQEGLVSGKKLNASLSDYFPNSLKRMIAVGEESGALGAVLFRGSELYHERAESLIKSFTLVLEPASTLLVGAFVGFIALAMLMPLFSMVNSLL